MFRSPEACSGGTRTGQSRPEGNSGKDAFLSSEPLNDCFTLSQIWKSNKGKDWNLVTEGVACVTVGERILLVLPWLGF